MKADLPIAKLYVEMVSSSITLLRSLNDDDWAKPVPCTPEWNVRDVLSHVSGLADDITNGRVDGAGTDPWTAAQVERYKNDDPALLITRWQGQASAVGQLLESIEEIRPVYDCLCHEHDLRHGLNRPGNRDLDFVSVGAGLFATTITSATPSTIKIDDGRTFGTGDAVVENLSSFEIFRSCLGRRTRDQVAAYNWSGPQLAIDDTIAGWFSFGPSEIPIHE